MKINHLQIMSASALDLTLTPSAPVCILHGHLSELALDLIRELIGDGGAKQDPDRVDDGRFVIHADVEMDGKEYRVCYLRNSDFLGDRRIAVSFETMSTHFSEADTREFIRKCRLRDQNDSNVLTKNVELPLSSDDRPLFIYDCFDRLDEGIDITPILNALSSANRQVFVSVCENYPIEKLSGFNVQVVKM